MGSSLYQPMTNPNHHIPLTPHHQPHYRAAFIAVNLKPITKSS
jgi:hypothetical protein